MMVKIRVNSLGLCIKGKLCRCFKSQENWADPG